MFSCGYQTNNTTPHCFVIAVNCHIEAQSYAIDPSYSRRGFVYLNGVDVWNASWTGFVDNRGEHILLIDPFHCSVQESRRFDTFYTPFAAVQLADDASTELADYLKSLSQDSIIVVVTAYDVTYRNQLANAQPTLKELGVDLPDSKGAFAFVAQKGFPEKTVLTTTGKRVVDRPYFDAVVTGRL